MKSIATLNSMYQAIHQAHIEWVRAIIDNMKEVGTELKVVDDNYNPEDGWPEGLHLVVMDDNNYPKDIVIDRVKYQAGSCYGNIISIHLCYQEPEACDTWWNLSYLTTDTADTVLNAIQWPEEINK